MAAHGWSGSRHEGTRRGEVIPALAEVEAQWLAHIGADRMAQLRETLTLLREITDPFLKDNTP